MPMRSDGWSNMVTDPCGKTSGAECTADIQIISARKFMDSQSPYAQTAAGGQIKHQGIRTFAGGWPE